MDCPTVTVQVRLGTNATTISITVEVISTVTPDPDLIVNKDDTPDPIVVGENVVHTVTVTNSGPSAS